MGPKTIRLGGDGYDRLQARKRDDESVSDLVDRRLEETTPDWRDGFGSLSTEESDELESIVSESRTELRQGLSRRQDAVGDENRNV